MTVLRPRRFVRLRALLLTLTLGLAACGGGNGQVSTAITTSSTTTTTTTAADPTTTATPPDDGSLPGERVEIFPYKGAELMVVGVAAESDVVVVDGPKVGDLAEITMDVIGLGDDAVGGERLVIFAQVEDGGRRFRVRSVELTTLCSRAVAEDGLCT